LREFAQGEGEEEKRRKGGVERNVREKEGRGSKRKRNKSTSDEGA
jgi:hypothetical protein